MQNLTKNAKNRRESKFLGARRNSFLTKRISKLGFNFIKVNKGTVTVCKTPLGSYKATFSSKVTGKTAFAYGIDFGTAYQNMIRLFNLKYAV